MPLAKNLYDVLGLKRYASVDEVKTAFKKLAVQHHPDKNPGNVEAEEHFKEIANAYSVLGDEEKKREYDVKLSGYYSYAKQTSPEEIKRRRRAEGMERFRIKQERERQEIEADYEKAKLRMPYKFRYAVALLLALWGMELVFGNFFLNEAGFGIFLVMAGFIIILFAHSFFFGSLFKKWNAENQKNPLPFNFYSRLVWLFISSFVSFCAAAIIIAFWVKDYHLKHYSRLSYAIVVYRHDHTIKYRYNVEGREIVKSYDLKDNENLYIKDVLEIKYSLKNPNIAVIVKKVE